MQLEPLDYRRPDSRKQGTGRSEIVIAILVVMLGPVILIGFLLLLYFVGWHFPFAPVGGGLDFFVCAIFPVTTTGSALN